MAYRIRVTVDYDWVAPGSGNAALQPGAISNLPGYGATQGPGMAGISQTLQLRVAEQVPGGAAPSQGNFDTALAAAAADITTLMGTSGAYSGGPDTPLALIQGWATGGA